VSHSTSFCAQKGLILGLETLLWDSLHFLVLPRKTAVEQPTYLPHILVLGGTSCREKKMKKPA